MNQLISTVENGVTTNFTYDPNGNMTQKTKGIEWWKYYYDYENRLTKVEHFDGTQTSTLGEYYYDGDGKRIKKVEASQTTIYIYLGWNIIYEKEFSTMTETKYVFGPNGHVAKIVGQTKYYYHSDHLGSLRQETDEAGNTLWSSPAQYEPFGEMRSGGPEKDGYFYTGKLRDASTGLYYYGNRYYDPSQARFLTKHILSGTASNSQTWNPYIYTLNNPLKYIDPTGNSDKEAYVTSKSGRVLRILGAGGAQDVSGDNMWDRDGTIVKIIPNNTGTNPSSTVNPTPAPAPTTTPTSNPNPTITGDPSYINGIVTWPTLTKKGPISREQAYNNREMKYGMGPIGNPIKDKALFRKELRTEIAVFQRTISNIKAEIAELEASQDFLDNCHIITAIALFAAAVEPTPVGELGFAAWAAYVASFGPTIAWSDQIANLQGQLAYLQSQSTIMQQMLTW